MRKSTRPFVVRNVRMQSAAGYHLGSIEICNGEAQPYDRDSLYYPSEEHLFHDYPKSKSLRDVFIRYGI